MRPSSLSMGEYCDAIEALLIRHSESPVNIDKMLAALDLKAEEALVGEDEFGETTAALAAQDAMMDLFPSAVPEELLQRDSDR